MATVSATTGGAVRPGDKAPRTWSELLAAANLPAFDRETAGTQGPVVREIPGFGEVTFVPQNFGAEPWSARYVDATGKERVLATNAQAGSGGDSDALYDFEPEKNSIVGGLWKGAVKPLIPVIATAVGANALAGNLGAFGSTAGSAGSTAGSGAGFGDLSFWEAGMSGGAPAGATGGAGALAGTSYAGMATQAAAPVLEKSFNATLGDTITNTSPSLLPKALLDGVGKLGATAVKIGAKGLISGSMNQPQPQPQNGTRPDFGSVPDITASFGSLYQNLGPAYRGASTVRG